MSAVCSIGPAIHPIRRRPYPRVRFSVAKMDRAVDRRRPTNPSILGPLAVWSAYWLVRRLDEDQAWELSLAAAVFVGDRQPDNNLPASDVFERCAR